MSQLKLGNVRLIFPIFACCENIFEFIIEGQSFPRASLSEHCELRTMDGVRGEISDLVFVPDGAIVLIDKIVLLENTQLIKFI